MGKASIKKTPPAPASTIGASDLERIVVLSGPQSALPDRCQQHVVNSGLAYRPVVDTHEGVERIYAKYGLPLFEILDATRTGNATPDEDSSRQDDNGPAGAVLRRRRTQQLRQRAGASKAAKSSAKKPALEDISDEHYQKLHKKPEYIEKRIRNREIELYQYARWQEGQRRESERRQQQLSRYNQGYTHHIGETGGGSEAGTQASSRCASPLHISSVEPGRDKSEPSAEAHNANGVGQRARKRAKPAVGMRKDVVKNSPLTRAASPAPSSGSNSPCSPSADADPHGEELRPAGHQVVLTDAERKTAHIAGNILEQLMVQAARLPMQTMPESPASLSRSTSPEESSSAESEDEPESDTSSDANSSSSGEVEGSDAGDQSDSSTGSEAADETSDCNGCGSCCPREFALPPRLTASILKQRKAQAEEKRGRKTKLKSSGR
ncbi:hypothetical protein IWW52_004033 [Coemansia sp. RSA 2704]|nr:hypothetical protein IWW52_004033 [Coemansia sp. RSA 2704]